MHDMQRAIIPRQEHSKAVAPVKQCMTSCSRKEHANTDLVCNLEPCFASMINTRPVEECISFSRSKAAQQDCLSVLLGMA